MRLAYALLLTLLPLPAAANCTADEQIFTCQIGAQALDLCRVGDDLVYAFGPKGAPDLQIVESLTTVDFMPWPGAGSNVWENVTFDNGGYSYEVWTLVERNPEDTKGVQGGVRVMKGDETVSDLFCDQGTASNSLDLIWDLKESVGMCWEFASISWKTTCDNG